jgi:hypothetical protein
MGIYLLIPQLELLQLSAIRRLSNGFFSSFVGVMRRSMRQINSMYIAQSGNLGVS